MVFLGSWLNTSVAKQCKRGHSLHFPECLRMLLWKLRDPGLISYQGRTQEDLMKIRFSFWLSMIFAAAVMVPAAHADAAKGAELYKSKCAVCHGPDGKGETTMGKKLNLKDLAGPETQNLHDSELKTLLERGKLKMPAFKDKLTNQQMEDLVQFIRTLKKK